MKLWVVKMPEDRPTLWGLLNEAVVRAETAEDAKRLLGASWGEQDLDELVKAYACLQVAELRADGPAGIVSGTAVS